MAEEQQLVNEYSAQPRKSKYEANAHTPDPTAYHQPDARQVDRMRGSGRMRGTIIPRATTYGGSQGFKQAAGIVNIIDMADDRAEYVGTLDMETLKASDVQDALTATNGDTRDAFAILARGQNLPMVKTPSVYSAAMPRENPVMPGSYVVPRSAVNGRQIVEPEATPMTEAESQFRNTVPLSPSVKARPNRPPLPKFAQATPGPAPHRDFEQEAADEKAVGVAPSAMNNPEVFSFLQRMESQFKEVMAQAGQVPVQQAPARSEPTRSLPIPENIPGPTNPMRAAFEGLGIPFLTPEPQKPKIRLIFDLGPGGQLTTTYHDAIERGLYLILVYDTRYEAGTQFLPPYRKDGTIRVTNNESGKTYNVFSQDICFSIGCLDMCVLLISQDSDEPDVPSPTSAPTLKEVMINVDTNTEEDDD